MDPVTGAVVIAGITAAGKPTAEGLIAAIGRLVNPSLDAVGEGAAANLKAWAAKRQELASGTLLQAAHILVTDNIEPKPVPGRILFPLLLSASVEEDSDLRRMWATLLANAADSGRKADMMPSFVSILKSLLPVEAVVLEAVYHDENKTDANDHRIAYLPEHSGARFNPDKMRIFAGPERTQIREVELPFSNFRVMADNLARLGLIEATYYGATRSGGNTTMRSYAPLVLSPLGFHFIRECVLTPKQKST